MATSVRRPKEGSSKKCLRSNAWRQVNDAMLTNSERKIMVAIAAANLASSGNDSRSVALTRTEKYATLVRQSINGRRKSSRTKDRRATVALEREKLDSEGYFSMAIVGGVSK